MVSAAPSIARPFRFDANEHQYIDPANDEVLPHITGLLEAGRYVNSQWFTEDSKWRGSAVHRMTAEYDLKALTLEGCKQSKYRGWLLAYAAAMAILKPEWFHIEEPLVHWGWRFGGQPDRAGRYYGAFGELEVKSGSPEKAHAIQMALQAILLEPEVGIPAETHLRFAVYLSANGRFKFKQFEDKSDFDKARKLLKQYTRGVAA